MNIPTSKGRSLDTIGLGLLLRKQIIIAIRLPFPFFLQVPNTLPSSVEGRLAQRSVPPALATSFRELGRNQTKEREGKTDGHPV